MVEPPERWGRMTARRPQTPRGFNHSPHRTAASQRLPDRSEGRRAIAAPGFRARKADADALLTERIRVSGGGTHGLPNPPPRPVRRRAFLPGAKAQKLPENATPNGETCTSTPATRPE